MLKFSKIALLSALLAISAGARADEFTTDKPVALVNGVAIPQMRLDMRMKIAMQQGQPDNAEVRKAVRDDLINLEVLSQAASKNGLDTKPEVAQQLAMARESVLANAYAMSFVKDHPISDEALQQEYDKFKARVGNKEYKLSHILVKTEDEAKQVEADLHKKGAKFSKIAKEHSQDPGSADKGGDLGWAVPSNFVQPFAEAVVKLDKGQISAPVQTQFGWHIIKLEDTRDAKIPTFEEMKPRIQNSMEQKAFMQEIENLHSKAKIE